MSFISNLFGKKKKAFKATCDISKEPVEKGFGYLLTTSQIVSSKRFWDNVMTEPETMSYTISHFKNQDKTATQMRNMIFEKYSTQDKSWIISDSYIQLFEVNKEEARKHARTWWENEGNYSLETSGTAVETMNDNDFKKMKEYAVMEAGRERVA
ncbi:hypothetical protein LVD17_01625 [Fulvivirga ulvae]|uniref:hypothetical protein n=1 Tax=Fulvivirga ulvae TaxID=2904245 RepID=UPI001F16AF3A|nr:hypothetical protein [Fulvivirga ulvae]UII32538.1 hypothetical protein LVD17_01625 [Fulvivirga ulvae]